MIVPQRYLGAKRRTHPSLGGPDLVFELGLDGTVYDCHRPPALQAKSCRRCTSSGVHSRLFPWYARLREIETKVDVRTGDRDALLDELDELDHVTHRITVPLSYTNELYALRNNIYAVRRRLLSIGSDATSPETKAEAA